MIDAGMKEIESLYSVAAHKSRQVCITRTRTEMMKSFPLDGFRENSRVFT